MAKLTRLSIPRPGKPGEQSASLEKEPDRTLSTREMVLILAVCFIAVLVAVYLGNASVPILDGFIRWIASVARS